MQTVCHTSWNGVVRFIPTGVANGMPPISWNGVVRRSALIPIELENESSSTPELETAQKMPPVSDGKLM
jgi:hypothetical protein